MMNFDLFIFTQLYNMAPGPGSKGIESDHDPMLHYHFISACIDYFNKGYSHNI
jgi:hypothetical protein